MPSEIFYSDDYRTLENRIKSYLNDHEDFMSVATVSSTRAVGDAIQGILEASFESILGDFSEDYSSGFARRAMADLAFSDRGYFYVVDVKTHRLDTAFNMPNLTSVERLSRFYEDDQNYFVTLVIAYNISEAGRLAVEQVYFVPIEFLSWSCLTIGALGWGQIQIANSNNIIINPGYSRKEWMLAFCDVMSVFYPREIEKIADRTLRFENIKRQWEQKEDIWR